MEKLENQYYLTVKNTLSGDISYTSSSKLPSEQFIIVVKQK